MGNKCKPGGTTMSMTVSTLSQDILQSTVKQAPSSTGNSVSQQIQNLKKQIGELTKELSAMGSKINEVTSEDEAKLLKQQMEMIQRQIESIYAKIAQLQKQEAEKNQMVSGALPTVSDKSGSNVAGNNTKNIDVYV
jgi:peptidoglycan hydrolase CwlO-like protein